MASVILLSGGSGMRLWPLSNEARSKQFLKVLRDRRGEPQSMVQRTIEQIRRTLGNLDLAVVTSASQVSSIQAQISGPFDLVVEPSRRDTTAAILLAAAYECSVASKNDDEVLVVMPIDSFVEDHYFELVEKLEQVVKIGDFDIALLGVEPSAPSSKFGYIIPSTEDSGCGDALKVDSFKEKPDLRLAEELISRGALWNCGVFAMRLGYLRQVLLQYLSQDDFDYVRVHFEELPKKSFDYEVVEKASSIAVVPYRGQWKDLGTWNSLTEEMDDAVSGLVTSGELINTHVVNELNIPVVALGLNNCIVAATSDGILVADKDASSTLKEYVNKAALGRAMHENRVWGEYCVLDHESYSDGSCSLTKRLRIEEGCQISYQTHYCRDEIWTIVDGEGLVVLDGVIRGVSKGDSVQISSGMRHAVRAVTELQMIEVQLGNPLTEEDIERFGYYWPE